MRVIFLGTAGSFPTVERSLPAVAVQRSNELFLFDCGEGAQRQMFIAGIGFRYQLRIFVSHMHGDHVLGLPGLLQTMSLLNVNRGVEVYGPQGIKNFLRGVKANLGFKLTFPLEVREVGEGVLCKGREYQISSAWTDHGVPNLAYALIENQRPGRFHPEEALSQGVPEGPLWSQLQRGEEITLACGRVITPGEVMGPPRPGRKIVYSGDTRPCGALLDLAENADLLIHEATFDKHLAQKADRGGHSTSHQAALIAKRADVKRLALTHIGSRYKNTSTLLRQATDVFSNALIAEDFTELIIPYPPSD